MASDGPCVLKAPIKRGESKNTVVPNWYETKPERGTFRA